MDVFGMVYRWVEHISTGKVVAAGGAGSGISIMAARIADPAMLADWLQVATLTLGLITGLGSVALVYLKLWQTWRTRRD